MKLPIRILSDLHMAHPACRIRSVDALKPLVEGAKTLILNGDTAEQRHSDLRARGRRMFDTLINMCGEYGVESMVLRGNHDPEISELNLVDLPQFSTLVTHGDVLFPLISAWNPKIWPVAGEMQAIRDEIGEETIATDLESALEATHRCRFLTSGDEREFRARRFKNLQAIKKLAWPPRRPVEILKCWMQTPGLAEDFLRRHRPDRRFFIFGHTHRPGIWEREGKVLINTGGFLSIGAAQVVEIERETISIFKIDESEAFFRKGKLTRNFFLNE